MGPNICMYVLCMYEGRTHRHRATVPRPEALLSPTLPPAATACLTRSVTNIPTNKLTPIHFLL